jgi:hypothetical protein
VLVLRLAVGRRRRLSNRRPRWLDGWEVARVVIVAQVEVVVDELDVEEVVVVLVVVVRTPGCRPVAVAFAAYEQIWQFI